MKINLCVLLLVLSLASALSLAKEKTYGDVQVSMVSTVYDGDTFYVTINGWPAIIGNHIAVRVKGIDTPEIKGKCIKEVQQARKAKQFTVEFLRTAKTITLKNMTRDKYFRINADVYADNKNLAEALISSGLAGVYEGKKKQNWCRSGLLFFK